VRALLFVNLFQCLGNGLFIQALLAQLVAQHLVATWPKSLPIFNPKSGKLGVVEQPHGRELFDHFLDKIGRYALAFHTPPNLGYAAGTVVDEPHGSFVDLVVFVLFSETRYLLIGKKLSPAKGHGQVVGQTETIALVQVDIDAILVSFLNSQRRDRATHASRSLCTVNAVRALDKKSRDKTCHSYH
jgi:hypothetical protein